MLSVGAVEVKRIGADILMIKQGKTSTKRKTYWVGHGAFFVL